jgi:hypothetical protein
MPRLIHMPDKRKRRSRTIKPYAWHALSFQEKLALEAAGSVYRLTETSGADTYRLEWGTKNVNRGTIAVHGTAEQARALLTFAYTELNIREEQPDRAVVHEFIASFCTVETNTLGRSMRYITREIPHAEIPLTQYQRAHSFLRSLLVRTLRNLYESVTGEKIS